MFFIDCVKPAGEIQVPQGESGSVCCHTEVSGQEKEVRWERGTQTYKAYGIWFWMLMLMFCFFEIQWSAVFLLHVFGTPAGLVNPQHKLGRCSRSQRAPLPTGAKHSSGDLVLYIVWFHAPLYFLVFTVPRKSVLYIFFFSFPRVLKPSQGQNSPVPGQLNRQGSVYTCLPLIPPCLPLSCYHKSLKLLCLFG